MKTKASTITRLEDYRPPNFHITQTKLTIDLAFSETRITASHQIQKNSEAKADSAPNLELDLDTDMVSLESLAIDNQPLTAKQYQVKNNKLTIFDAPDQFELAIENTTFPHKNTALSGLYQSQDMLCTQCEAEGFRRITPAIDRPDNLSQFYVTLRADKKQFPLLLCNGNLVEQGELEDGKHYATWHDPFVKPTYLFAIVAGDLACLEDSFTTCNQREVALRFYARARDIDKCRYAMDALKRAMKWDEEIYGREYDLDLFNVVAVHDFNMGAMENKSLNIFNTQYVLADSKLVTDDDFVDIEAVIGHEYFHNWSGNRVTCRDWFQLSLKEGFTVFREQQFSADMGSAAVKRIYDVASLRAHQFPEDAGSMAHPVRPDSYLEINNFYTSTVYNKGAEVIRMLHTLLGAKKFRKATDAYFERHDGQAVTTDDFVAAMADVSGTDLEQFQHWYQQAGTPRVEVNTEYDEAQKTFTIDLKQSCAATPKQPKKKPFVIPIRMALFDDAGKRMRVGQEKTDDARKVDNSDDQLLVLSKPQQSFEFNGVGSKPVVSLLREFTAPVELRYSQSDRELALLFAHDDDPFSRWEAGQKLLLKRILDNVERIQSGKPVEIDELLIEAFDVLLDDAKADPALQATVLTLPAQSYINEHVETIDPIAIFNARHGVKQQLAKVLKPKLFERYHQLNRDNDGSLTAEQIGKRSLRDACLGLLVSLDEPEVHELAATLLANSHCMTDSAAALSALANSSMENRHALLDEFYTRWKDEPLVVDQWLRIQATVANKETLSRVQSLTRHEAFDHTNPNKVYALLFGFTHGNPFCFHAIDGSGYQFAYDWVTKLDPLNSQVCARLVLTFNHWRKYKPELQSQMRTALENISKLPNLSRDVEEIVGKSLSGG